MLTMINETAGQSVLRVCGVLFPFHCGNARQVFSFLMFSHVRIHLDAIDTFILWGNQNIAYHWVNLINYPSGTCTHELRISKRNLTVLSYMQSLMIVFEDNAWKGPSLTFEALSQATGKELRGSVIRKNPFGGGSNLMHPSSFWRIQEFRK